MPTTLVPYLNFPGNTRAAMEFYQSIFGGTLEILTFADFHLDDMPPEGTMHAYLKADGFNIAASDAMPGAESTWGGTRVYLAFMSDDESILPWFDALAAGGSVSQPIEPQAWGASYGLVTDKFGLEWMFNVGPGDAAV